MFRVSDPLVALQYLFLKAYSPGAQRGLMPEESATTPSTLRGLFPPDFLSDIQGKTALDFGCGEGLDVIAMAKLGAARVIGLDIRAKQLESARRLAAAEGVADRCEFAAHQPKEKVDIILSVDSFEHYSKPAAILAEMHEMLKPGGQVWISFGPPWYHPAGGHLFSVFPWAHLLLSQKALMRWRSDFKSDGARRFEEVEGGLNKLGVGAFEKLLRNTPFRVEFLRAVPISQLASLPCWLRRLLPRELFSSRVCCKLTKA